MTSVHGTYHDGQIELNFPVDWPDGLRVGIVVPDPDAVGLSEDEWPTTPEAIAEYLARYDAIEPIIFPPKDEVEIAAARQAVREKSIEAVRRQMGLE